MESSEEHSNSLVSEEVLGGLDRRYRGIPESHRPLLWHVASGESYASHRGWIESEYAHLGQDRRNEMRTVLLDHDLLVGVLSELAVMNVFRLAGRSPVSGPEMSGLTPDVYLAGDDHRPSVIVEVWTRSLARAAVGGLRRWAQLARVIEDVPRPAGVAVRSLAGGEPLPAE